MRVWYPLLEVLSSSIFPIISVNMSATLDCDDCDAGEASAESSLERLS
jgi:hypothetical protein